MFVSRKKFRALQEEVDRKEARIVELARQYRDICKENKQLKTIGQQQASRIVDLENNVEFVTNNLSDEKKELVFGPENQN